jgi:hypothetical protein
LPGGALLVAIACSAQALAQPASAPGAALPGARTPEAASQAPAADAAARPQLRVGLSLGRTDNVGRNTSEVPSDLTILDLGFNARTDQRRLKGALLGDLEFRHYGADTLIEDHEVFGSVDGKLGISLVPQRFVWDFEENYGQTRIDPLQPVGPNNRQRTVVVSTGPRLDVPLGGRNALQLAAQLAERTYESSNQLDGRTTSARLGFSHALDTVTKLSVTFDSSRNEFDNDQQAYEFRILSVAYAKTLATGDAEVRIGRGKVDIGAESTPTTVGRIEWRRNIGTRSRLNLWAGRELTDAGELFRYGGIVGGGATAADLSAVTSVFGANDSRLSGIALSNSPLRRSTVGTRVDLLGRALTVRIGASVARDRFELDDTLDNDSTTLELSLGRDFARRWNGDLRFSVVRQDFAIATRDNEDRASRLMVTRKLASRSRVSVVLERNRRDGGVGLYTETVYLVSVGHDFGRP